MANPLNDMNVRDYVQSIMSPDFKQRAAEMQDRILFKQDAKDEEVEKLRGLAQSVLDNPAGHALLQDLSIRTLSRPVFPPPPGSSAGEYAAQRQGQIDMITWMISLIGDDNGRQ